MMTEDEAKTKWCPMTRYSVAVGPAGDVEVEHNRLDGAVTALPLCIGSGCMMWRVDPLSKVLIQDTQKIAYERGYCGLSGRPG